MCEIRKFLLGSCCELTFETGILEFHHTIRFNSGYIGRAYTIFDGQIRTREKEKEMHRKFPAGNNNSSWVRQEKNNWLLYSRMVEYLARGSCVFSVEIEKAIVKWIEFFPNWLREAEMRKWKSMDPLLLKRISRENKIKKMRRCKEILRSYRRAASFRIS